MQELKFTQPDDFHVHLRDGEMLKYVVHDTAKQFARAIVMPNLEIPITTTDLAIAYHQRILENVNVNFKPLMTLYLTDNTTSDEIIKAQKSGIIYGVKLYPAHVTTNSNAGVTNLENCESVLTTMQSIGLPLLIHGEVNYGDIFDRESIFIRNVLIPLIQKFPSLKIVLEHITTTDAVNFVLSASKNVAATITAHHLLLNRNDMFQGGINPHHYCLPILKREEHRCALLKAATSGNPKFFLGTDSAPHSKLTKETACGCAGVYTSHNAIEFYAKAFESVNALDKLEGFASFFGADFYGLSRNTLKINLIREVHVVPSNLFLNQLIPFQAGEFLQWKLVQLSQM